VNFIFRPAGEVGGSDSGATRMIRDGLFDQFPCDAIFSIHNGRAKREGPMFFREGPFICSSELVMIVINGSSSHGIIVTLQRKFLRLTLCRKRLRATPRPAKNARSCNPARTTP